MSTAIDRAECALAYALWDAENSTKLERPEDLTEYLLKARSVMAWLKVHGARVQSSKRKS